MIATDFFAAQDRARANSKRLVLLFMLAVIGIVLAVSACFFLVMNADVLAVTTAGPERQAILAEAFLDSLPAFGWMALFTFGVVGAASGVKWLQIREGGPAIAEMLGGTRIDPMTSDPFERRLVNIVEEMAIASGVPLPEIYLLAEEESINAFAAGLTTSDAVVAVTKGAIEQLSRDELQAVIAHEFGHILNGDMRLNARLIAMLAGIFVFVVLGRIAIRVAIHSGGRRRNNKDATPLAFLAVGVGLIILGSLGFFFGRLIQAAISRQREFLADASAVQFTRNPLGLTGAFKKIGGLAAGSRILNPHSSEMSHAYFAQGFRDNFLTRLFATHPPLIERIRVFEPNFTGEYAEPLSREEALRELEREKREAKAPPKPRRPLGMPIPMDAPMGSGKMGEPAAMIGQIGILDELAQKRAHEIHQAFPERLHAAAQDSEQVRALVYALLFERESEGVRAQQLQLLERSLAAEEFELTKEFGALTLSMGARLRLPLAQIAFPQLRHLEGEERSEFLRILDGLAQADGQIDAFEFALTRLFSHHLKTAHRPLEAKERYRSLGGLQDELSMLFSFLAGLAEPDEAIPRAFEVGVARLELQGVRLLEPRKLRFEALDLAIETLSLTRFALRKKILEGLAITVASDGRFTDEEADLLRAISSIFECPMPPIPLDEAEIAASAHAEA